MAKCKVTRKNIFEVYGKTYVKNVDLGEFVNRSAAMEAVEIDYCQFTGNEDGIEFGNDSKWHVIDELDMSGVNIVAKEDDGSIFEYRIEYLEDEDDPDEEMRKTKKNVRELRRVMIASAVGIATFAILRKIRKNKKT